MSRGWQLLVLGVLILATLATACAGPPGRETAGGSAQGTAAAGRLGPVEARELLAAHPEALLLDVRNPGEWNDDLGHIEGARLIPLPELAGRMEEIAAWKDRPVVVVCRSGGRSSRAASMLAAAGFRQAMNLDGGMSAWRRAGF